MKSLILIILLSPLAGAECFQQVLNNSNTIDIRAKQLVVQIGDHNGLPLAMGVLGDSHYEATGDLICDGAPQPACAIGQDGKSGTFHHSGSALQIELSKATLKAIVDDAGDGDLKAVKSLNTMHYDLALADAKICAKAFGQLADQPIRGSGSKHEPVPVHIGR